MISITNKVSLGKGKSTFNLKQFSKENIEAVHCDRFVMPMTTDQWKDFKEQLENNRHINRQLYDFFRYHLGGHRGCH